MNINSAGNMMYLPVAPGIDPNPNLGLHNGWTTQHAAYNAYVFDELERLNLQARSQNWDYRRTQAEVGQLQRNLRVGFQTGKHTCA